MSGVWKITVLGWNVEELRGLLVLADLPQGHSARTVPVGLLHSSSRRGGFASSLGGQLLPWSLASGGLAGGLLGASHVERGGRWDVKRERAATSLQQNETKIARTLIFILFPYPPGPGARAENNIF